MEKSETEELINIFNQLSPENKKYFMDLLRKIETETTAAICEMDEEKDIIEQFKKVSRDK